PAPGPASPTAWDSRSARARAPRGSPASRSSVGGSPLRVHDAPHARDKERLAVVRPPQTRLGGPLARLARGGEVAQVADVVAERGQTPEEDGLRVAHRRAPGAGEIGRASCRESVWRGGGAGGVHSK